MKKLSFLVVILLLGCSVSHKTDQNQIYPKIYSESGHKVIVGNIYPPKHDADSFYLDDLIHVRLKGVDAFEYNQYCLDKKNQFYSCGEKATSFFNKLVDEKTISCHFYGEKGSTQLKRPIVKCYSHDGKDLQKEIILAGWGISAYGDEYKSDEAFARQNKNGAWNGKFKTPESFRKCKGLARKESKLKACSK
ncbi:MAG: thermonuclease family protein [Alphaproteobacteria bacterium]|nr:thermonuclease family protein [Alphaproteobacteria bacterium]